MKTYNLNGRNITIEQIMYRFRDELDAQPGLLIHDEADENHDGDCIIGNACTMPETAEEAADILANEYCCHYIELQVDGIWHVDD